VGEKDLNKMLEGRVKEGREVRKKMENKNE
jgi:hypothetical protein